MALWIKRTATGNASQGPPFNADVNLCPTIVTGGIGGATVLNTTWKMMACRLQQ